MKSGQEQSSDKDRPTTDGDNRPTSVDNDATKQTSGNDKPTETEVNSSKPAAAADPNPSLESSDKKVTGGDPDKTGKSDQGTSSFSSRADQETLVKKTSNLI